MARYIGNCRSLEEIAKNRKEFKFKISELKREIRHIKFSSNFKLSEEDQKHYDSWNKMIEENKRNAAEIFKPYKDEKTYAIRGKQGQINLYENALVKLVCEEKGHDEASSHVAHGSHTGTRVYAKCRRCGMGYTRSLTSKESQSLTKTLNTPMTI